MIAAWDIDGVLAETVDPILNFRNERFGTNYQRGDMKTFDFENLWGGTRKEAIAFFHEFFGSPHFPRLKPVEGAVEAVLSLERKGYRNIAVSARPLDIAEQTNSWIKQHFGDSIKGVILNNHYAASGDGKYLKKADICLREGASFLVEDCLTYALECADARVPVYLLDCPWNRCDSLPTGVKRVQSLNELVLDLDNQR